MQRFLNNYETTLALGINDTITSIQVYPSTAFDDVAALTGGDYYLLTISDGTNIEIVKVTNVSVGPIHILTVVRDVSSSGHGAFAFAAGASVKMSVVAETLQALNEVLLNADYPPNYTVNVQTRSTAGTVSVPFTPLVIQQVNIDVASGVTLNVTPGATWGECVITLYRTNLSHAWPSLAYNGNVVPIAGEPPGSGSYNAKLLCRSEPGSGYLPNPFVTFEWITVATPSAPSVNNLGTIAVGATLTINPLTASKASRALLYSGVTINFDLTSYPAVFTEIYLAVSLFSTAPTIKYNNLPVTVAGTPPATGNAGILKATFVEGLGSYQSIEWLPYSTVD